MTTTTAILNHASIQASWKNLTMVDKNSWYYLYECCCHIWIYDHSCNPQQRCAKLLFNEIKWGVQLEEILENCHGIRTSVPQLLPRNLLTAVILPFKNQAITTHNCILFYKHPAHQQAPLYHCTQFLQPIVTNPIHPLPSKCCHKALLQSSKSFPSAVTDESYRLQCFFAIALAIIINFSKVIIFLL